LADASEEHDMADSKYHQVAVPDHPGGSSFVRLGSFPSSSDPAPFPASFEKSRGLAGVVSASRLTTSGHWSHSDGNRVTTTVGNVVDVINGSYLAYRSAAASPPGPTLTATWAASVYTQTGSEDMPVGNGAAVSDPTGSPPDDNVAYETAFATATTPNVDSNPADTKASPGDAVTATWAGRVITYAGSAKTPVTYVLTQTYAGKVATNTYTTKGNATLNSATGGDVTATTTISGGGSSDTTTTISGGGSSNTTSTVHGGSVNTDTTITGGDSSTITNVSGGNVVTKTKTDQAITTEQMAPAITNVNTAVNNLNLTFGIVENITAGPAVLNLTAAAGIANINLGAQTNVNLPAKFQFEGLETVVSIEKTAATTLDTRFTGVTSRIDGVDTKITDLTTQVTNLKTAITDVRTQVDSDWTTICNIGAITGAMIMLGP
jgi:hypothetical protein